MIYKEYLFATRQPYKKLWLKLCSLFLKEKIVLNVLFLERERPGSCRHEVIIEHQLLRIPYRINCLEPSLKGDKTMQALLCALMTRHYSGFIRERWGKKLLQYPLSWTAPYVILLLEDYVLEILEMLNDNLSPAWEDVLHCFAIQNPAVIETMNRRIVSYWNCYYRFSYPDFKLYPGYLAASRLGLWNPKVARVSGYQA